MPRCVRHGGSSVNIKCLAYTAPMRNFALGGAALSLWLVACAPEPKPAPDAAKQVAAPKPADESSRFPKTYLVSTRVVDKELMGKSFMPGGTLAHYKKGKAEYDMFITKLPSAMDAAILLPDWRKAMASAKLVPSFGGYFGQDGERPVFVFTKEAWIAGIAGLPEKDADAQARVLAGALR
jgi:hypothetical protein